MPISALCVPFEAHLPCAAVMIFGPTMEHNSSMGLDTECCPGWRLNLSIPLASEQTKAKVPQGLIATSLKCPSSDTESRSHFAIRTQTPFALRHVVWLQCTHLNREDLELIWHDGRHRANMGFRSMYKEMPQNKAVKSFPSHLIFCTSTL